MQSNDVNAGAVNGKEAAYFGVPWEDASGYARAIKVGDTIYVSSQLSHTLLSMNPASRPSSR